MRRKDVVLNRNFRQIREVVRVIDAVKAAKATPIGLQIDDLSIN